MIYHLCIYQDMLKEQTKILVLRFSSIGDIVLTTPVMRNIKVSNSKAEIHFLTKSSFKGLITNNPHVDKVWHFSKNVEEVLPELVKEKFDYVVDLHKNVRTLRLKRSLKVKAFSFKKLNVEKFLMTSLKLDRLPKQHIVDRYLEAVTDLGVENDGQGLDYFPGTAAKPKFEALVKSLPEKYTVVVVGAAHKTKIPSVAKYQEILKVVSKNFVLIGGDKDVATAEKILTNLPGDVHNFCGSTTLDVSALLVKHAELVISPDTGMMHIAAAFKKPIISLWGNTIPEFGMTPYYGNHQVPSLILEVKGLSCRPCSKIGYTACPKKHFKCIEQLDVQLIKNWLDNAVISGS